MMEFNIHKINFRDKEYLIFSLEEYYAIKKEFNEDVNNSLERTFGDDAENILFFPTKVNFYGFKNIENE